METHAPGMITVERQSCAQPLIARALFSGPDLCVLVSGGDAPHIGSVSVGIPRKSLSGSGGNSATVSTFNSAGHKDDIVGNMFALRLSSEFSCTTSVSCGIHYREASPELLENVVRDASGLADDLVAAIRKTHAI